ncbi:PAS domain S-box protein [Azohydromonas lata]|uniref:histidine kinase n=1 Tax=Azohydromonas lata TaxID=45677 RepID=A0ABU5IMS2_9BURK|nr:PAS domain S-box protein [Azohydromonas lata]MDZ5460194.1 PAS domain S-box protein [Azohydromonas lata]
MSAPLSPPRPAPAVRRRLFGHWWRSQSPARQDRFVTVGPLVSVLLFLAAIISAFWYLRNEEIERETDSLKRDTEIAQQQIQLRLIDSQEQLLRLARELATRTVDSRGFEGQARSFAAERPELTQLLWLTPRRQLQGQWQSPGMDTAVRHGGDDPSLPMEGRRSEPERAFSTARDLQAPVYSRAFGNTAGVPVFQVYVPLIDRNGFVGALVAEYSVQALERLLVPAEVTRRHAISVLDEAGNELAGNGGGPATTGGSGSAKRAAIVHDVPLTPAGTGLVLRGQGWRTSIGLISNTLFWMVVALSVLTVWMLLGAWRHMRRRTQIQNALIQETNFRRAMENSMLTGMRAMDLQGRITYVNPAFCAMTGFSETELIDRRPPYPHWPPDRLDENARLLRQELQGRSPAGGVEVKVMRKDGQMFDARMYVSPLIDPKGQQTGWMTSMTNITEAKRIRDQLSASHERFTTVLEGLDAAVSVLSVEQAELLFANRSYRLWFGADARGHALLAGSPPQPGAVEDVVDTFGGLPVQELTQAGSDPREVYIESLQKWFDVRSRYLQWTDGRLAQMLIATDITARHQAEEQQRLQAEKAQVTSRLVTMGEMASSVAHELNQPLTAIANYCSGMVSRVEADAIAKEDLIAALRKTARQAERAGQIIHRIRAFVKKSEPQRQAAQARAIVEDAVDLAGIELRRRHVQIHTYVAQRLPTLMVDPILIEQVVLNLLKNAAEAIDMAKLAPARRHIELRVVPKHTAEEGGVIEFSVTDKGPGMKEEVLKRLFEAFFSTKAEGLGIGLSLCRSIIESHRGRMRAENIYNGPAVVGCRFSFTLPVEPGARIEPAAPAADSNSTTETTSP